jgi:hypothetical protein
MHSCTAYYELPVASRDTSARRGRRQARSPRSRSRVGALARPPRHRGLLSREGPLVGPDKWQRISMQWRCSLWSEPEPPTRPRQQPLPSGATRASMTAHRRLRNVAAALVESAGSTPTIHVVPSAKELAVSRAVEAELRGGAAAAELTAAETELAEQFYQLDLLGYLVIDNVLSQQEVVALNGILDARGVTAGVPETFEPPTDADGRECRHGDFIDFGGRVRPAGTTGSPIRFGSAGGGAPACPGFLNWGQPFADLLLHPKIVPFLAEFLDASGYGVRLDRLYGMHMKEVEEQSGRASNGRQYPMGLHQGVVSLTRTT